MRAYEWGWMKLGAIPRPGDDDLSLLSSAPIVVGQSRTLVRVRTTAPSGAAVVIVLPEKLPAAAAVTGCDAIIHLHGYREPGRDLVAEGRAPGLQRN